LPAVSAGVVLFNAFAAQRGCISKQDKRSLSRTRFICLSRLRR
jgi:hypothetical protein